MRRKTVFVLQKVFDTYVAVLAPIAPLLAEEIHHYARGATEDPKGDETAAGSVFEKGWPEPVSSLFLFPLALVLMYSWPSLQDARWNDSTVKQEMEQLLKVRDGVNALLETARNDRCAITPHLQRLRRLLTRVFYSRKLRIASEAALVLSRPTRIVQQHRKSVVENGTAFMLTTGPCCQQRISSRRFYLFPRSHSTPPSRMRRSRGPTAPTSAVSSAHLDKPT